MGREIQTNYTDAAYFTRLTYMRSVKSSFEVIPALCNNELSTAQSSDDVMRYVIEGDKVFSTQEKKNYKRMKVFGI